MSIKKTKFISIIWGYSENMYSFSEEENYHLHILSIAKQKGFLPCVIIKNGKKIIEKDPHFDSDIKIIEYKNIFNYLFNITKYSIQNSIFYVNSYEWQSFIVPFFSRRTIFMGHSQTKRSSTKLQKIQNFVFKFFKLIRLNNETEKKYLISQGTKKDKLMIVPLIVSQKIFKLEEKIQKKDLVYFGNITPTKNIETILKSFSVVRDIKPDIKLNIIGNIYDPNFETQVQKLKLEESIVIHGYLKQDSKLTNLLNSFLIYLNSSKSEGQCVAVYDAALCGCVLCLPNIMSFSDIFKEKALFHEVNDYEQLASNILQYLDKPDMIEEYREKCIFTIKEDYSQKVIEEKLKLMLSKI